MPSSLGVYIDNGLIKYAKLRKDRDSIKVEAFNIEFFDRDNLYSTIDKIVAETNSSKIPININISDELYNYFEVFSRLDKKDIGKSVDLEFDLLCSQKGYNEKTLETRYILMKSTENPDKLKVLHIAANKTEINKRIKMFDKCKINSVTPISTSITNLIEVNEKESTVIVNIENETKITTIVDGQIYRVDMLQEGMETILNEISKNENSIKKAYEVCKNITIYSKDEDEENEYTLAIKDTLQKIIEEVREVIEVTNAGIKKVYITGLGASINNIDLYFQEFFTGQKCEILKPFFAESGSIKIPIKEYIEVNSAIALALNGLGYINKKLNFTGTLTITKDSNVSDIIRQLANIKTSSNSSEKPLDKGEKLFIRISIVALLLMVSYIGFDKYSMSKMTTKEKEVAKAIASADVELQRIQEDINKIDTENKAYKISIDTLNKLNDQIGGKSSSRVIEKDAIPNFLNKVMFIVPQKVKVVSISNVSGKRISIEAQAERYEQLGYFVAALKAENVLSNVKSSSGTMKNNIVTITIEGELP